MPGRSSTSSAATPTGKRINPVTPAKNLHSMSGLILFPVGVAALLVLLRSGMGEDKENREQYYRAHRKYIDDIRYHEYLAQCQEQA